MNKKQLMSLLFGVPDNFNIEIRTGEIPNLKRFKISEIDDVGYSDKIIILGTEPA